MRGALVALLTGSLLACAQPASARTYSDCKGSSFEPAWIKKSGYLMVWYVEVRKMSCDRARAAIRGGNSRGRHTFATRGYRCTKVRSGDYGVGLTRDTFRCQHGSTAFRFLAYY